MKVYAVRQKSTGLFIPRFETGKRRGGSHLEPSNEREPRMFHSHLAARAFLGNWLQGIFENDRSTGLDGEEEYGLKVKKQSHRKKEDMEIVEFTCVENGHVSVVMGTDFPDSVFINKNEAEACCQERARTNNKLSGTVVHWRFYEFKLR